MRVCAIAGGVGSARFCAGLQRVIDPSELTVVVNTGDDERVRGLHVSADVDTVLYHLANATDWERGWGLGEETFVAQERYKDLVARAGLEADLQDWFALGDKDLATHQLRTRLLDLGRSLTEATDALRRAMGIGARVLPMSDEPVRTLIDTLDGDRLDFQTYFVRRQTQVAMTGVTYEGAEGAHATPEAVGAIRSADVIVIPPSNPILSIAPVLAVPGIRSAIEASDAAKVAVSPIVAGGALKGPADRVLAALGHEVSALGVARIYADLVGTFVLDEVDRELASDIEGVGLRAVVCDSIMRGPEDAARFAKVVLDAV